MTDLRELTLRVTAVLLVTSVVLIGPSLLSVGASLSLAVVLGGLAGLLYFVSATAPAPPQVSGHDLSTYQDDLWIGPALSAAVVLLFLGSTPGELQALGGIAGAAGMANYFLRPVYVLVASLFRRAL